MTTTSKAPSKRSYAICANCIMDTSDSNIAFDPRGWCDYCNNYHTNILPNWHTDERGERDIRAQVDRIKRDGEGKDHDCIIGISGGIDSSYVTHLAKAKFGLRPLLFHVDAGWNSQQAVNNIERLVDGLGCSSPSSKPRCRTSTRRRITPFLPRCTTLRPSTDSSTS
jgi:hypothetical protein